jgi:hypothetical protein
MAFIGSRRRPWDDARTDAHAARRCVALWRALMREQRLRPLASDAGTATAALGKRRNSPPSNEAIMRASEREIIVPCERPGGLLGFAACPNSVHIEEPCGDVPVPARTSNGSEIARRQRLSRSSFL